MPPTREPMEHPVTEVILYPRASSSSIAPIYANPLGHPLARTRATSFVCLFDIVCCVVGEMSLYVVFVEKIYPECR